MEKNMITIMIIDDNEQLQNEIGNLLTINGYSVLKPKDFDKIPKMVKDDSPDLVLLDINLPSDDGFKLCTEIRSFSKVPIIFITSRNTNIDELMAITLGGDDYITKPFSMLILGKRITALLRRSQSKPAVNMIKLGDVTVDFSGYTACDENGKIDITPKELEILKVLIDNKGLVLSRNQILDDVWGYDCDVIDRTIDAYIRNIRKKLRLDCITTVKGIGYKFEMGQAI